MKTRSSQPRISLHQRLRYATTILPFRLLCNSMRQTMQSVACCYRTTSLSVSHRTSWTTPRRIMLKLKRNVSPLSLAWISGTSTFMGNATSQYTQIINRLRQFSRSHSAKHLTDFSEWCWNYKYTNFQFGTRKERNFTLPTLCLRHLSLIALQHPMLRKSMRCSSWK